MNKWYYFIILLIIVLVVAGAYFLSDGSFSSSEQKIGNNTFTVPEGYHVVKSTDNSVKMTDKTTEVTLLISKETDLDNATKNYKRINSKDYNITITNGTFADMDMKKTEATITKSDGTNGTITKYWFVKNGTIYNIQSSNGTATIEKVAKGLIDSIV